MNPLDTFTKAADEAMHTLGSIEHYRRLQAEGTLHATRCDACGHAAFPPRVHCPACFGDDVTWEPVGPGTLYAFSTQKRALRFTHPRVVGIVEVPEVGLIVTPIGAELDALEIGMPMRPATLQIDDGKRTVHQFVPA